MNKIFKILIFILAIEILLGYAFYFKDSSLISGHYVSSSLRLIDKVFRSIKPITEDLNEKESSEDNLENNSMTQKDTPKKINQNECQQYEKKNQILSVSGFNSFRKPIKFQTDLNFVNTFDYDKDFLILLVGNSETFGWYQKDDDRLHSILQKKLRNKVNSDKIFVLNLSYSGGIISDHLTDVLNFSEIYKPDLVIFYTGGNELDLDKIYKDILENYSLNMKNFKLYSFEKKNEYSSSEILFPNTLQKCLADNLFLNEKKFKLNNSSVDVAKYIEENFEKISSSLTNKSIDFMFYIQPFNKQEPRSESTQKNYDKITSLSIPSKNFKNLNLLDKDLSINYVDLFHTKDSENISNYLMDDILLNFKELIDKKIINENN